MPPRKRSYMVIEVVSMLEDDDDFKSADIFILSPEDGTKSDRDSGPKDDDGDIDNLSGSQLHAQAEATLLISDFDKKHIGINDIAEDNDNEAEDDVLPLAA